MPVALILWHMIAAILTIYTIYILIQGDPVTSKTLRTLIDVGPSDQATANVGLQYQTLGTARTRQSDILLTPNNSQQCGSIVWTLDKPMGRDWVMTLNHRIGVNAGQGNPGDTMYVLVYRRSSETGCKYAPGQPVGDDSGYCIAFEVAKQQVTLYHDSIALKSGSVLYVPNAYEPITIQCTAGVFQVYYNGQLIWSYTDPKFQTRAELTNPDTSIEIGAITTSSSAEHTVSQIMLQE